MSVRIVIDGPVAWITIDRPDQMNALEESTRQALTSAIGTARDDPSVRAIVLTGQGRAFCAGQDLTAVDELDDAYDTVARTYNPIVETITGSEVPVVAAVNGPAVGAGMGIALACDAVVMAEKATYACVFGSVGLVPDTGTTWQLTRRLGHQRAFEIASTGRKIAAEEACDLGLATEMVPLDDLKARAGEIARQLADSAPLSLALLKQGLWAAGHQTLEQSLESEAVAQGQAAASADHLRLRDAFFARRR